MNSKVFLGFLVVVLGVGIGWYVLKGQQSGEGSPNTGVPSGQQNVGSSPEFATPPVGGAEVGGKGGAMEKVVVTYTDTGYSPKSVIVKKGTTVVFMNDSSGGMWTASALHPTHQLLPGFDQLESTGKGTSYEYTFSKVGTWKYHNHVKATDFGSVMVTD